MNNKEKFENRVLEILNKKHKTNFVAVHDEKIPEETFVIQANINGRNFIHAFDADITKLDYKLIKKYAKALTEIVKEDLIMAKKCKPKK